MSERDPRRPEAPEGLMGVVLGSVEEGVLGVDADGRITFANPAACRLLGYAAADLVGQPEHELLHRARADGTPYPRDRCPIQGTLTDGGVHHAYGEAFRRRDGTALAVEYTSTPLRDDGRLVGAAVVFRDARAGAGDRQAGGRAMAAYEAAPEALLAVDRDWRVLHLNAAAQRLRPPGEAGDAVGRVLWDVLPQLAGGRHEQELRRAVRERARVAVTEPTPGAGDAARVLEVSAAPADDGLAILLRDVTDRHRAEQAAKASAIERPLARKIMQDLVETGGVAHQVLTQVGRNLAAATSSATLDAFVKAFSEMGLGSVALERAEGQRYGFSGSDLLERRPGSRVATCSFTLGYLSEAVSRIHGNEPTLGTEIECQSRGAKECRFVVQVKKPEEGLARRVKELV